MRMRMRRRLARVRAMESGAPICLLYGYGVNGYRNPHPLKQPKMRYSTSKLGIPESFGDYIFAS